MRKAACVVGRLRSSGVALCIVVSAFGACTRAPLTNVTALGVRPGLGDSAYDVVIVNGKVVDGSGNPWFYGDVAIRGDAVRLPPGR